MRIGVRRLVALRRRHPVASVVAAVSAGALGLGAVIVAVTVTGSSARPAASATPSPLASADDTLLGQPTMADFADFRAVDQKPAASAPIKRLPRVKLASVTVSGIPPVPLAAYRAAARSLQSSQPGCHMTWWLIAGIGLVESGHARSGGSAYAGWKGVARPPIYGPPLDGRHGFKKIYDTDDGVLDGDKRYDRAVGPMQFLPSTWQTWGPPGQLDGHANPQNVFAAAKATAGYLCASGSDLAQPHAMALAVYSYNHSFNYVRLVLSVGARYAGMSPDELGVDQLPKDQPDKKKHKRAAHRHAKRNSTVRGVHRTTASPSPAASPTPSASASPTPSPSPSSQPLPNPLPTLTPPVLHY